MSTAPSMNKTILTVALALAAFTASAQTATPPVLKLPLAQGLKVHKSFEGPSGLTGWVLVKGNNDPLVVFTTADGKTLMSGAVLDESGTNLVAGYAEQHSPKPDYSNFADGLATASHAVQGDPKGKNVVYAFFDTACPYCNVAYNSFKSAQTSGTQVRWIPVAFLQKKSTGQAAAILGAKDPSAALAEHEQVFKSGGLAPVEGDATTTKKLEENLKLFRDMGFSGVPAILYRTPDGRMAAVKGAPSATDMPKILAGAGR